MIIKVPKDLEDDFKIFLDIAQFKYTKSYMRTLSTKEKRVIKLIRQIVGDYSNLWSKKGN